jgi:hypothetical protein
MKLINALELILSQMEFGEMRALSKDDFKFRVYELTGHYPGTTEFNKVFESLRTTVNKYGLVYTPNIGWYRTRLGINQYKKRLDKQIMKRIEIKQALR